MQPAQIAGLQTTSRLAPYGLTNLTLIERGPCGSRKAHQKSKVVTFKQLREPEPCVINHVFQIGFMQHSSQKLFLLHLQMA